MQALWRWLAGPIAIVLVFGLGSPGKGLPASAAAATGASGADVIAGVRWESMGGPPGAGRVSQLVQGVDPDHVLYAITEKSVFTSSDKGGTWDPVHELEGLSVSSVIPHEEGLVACGSGVHQLSAAGLRQLLPDACEAIAANADQIVAARGSDATSGVKVWRTDETAEWQDISPPTSLFDGLARPPKPTRSGITAGPIAAVSDGVLAGFRVWIEGGGWDEKGGLYRQDAATGAWSKVQLPAPDGAVVARLSTDTQRPGRVVATFRDRSSVETRHPISNLAFESEDGGRTWSRLTNSELEARGVTDIVDIGRERYLVNLDDGYLLRLAGSEPEVRPMPMVEGIPGEVRVETILIDPEDPAIAYAKPGSDWELGLVRSTDRLKTWHKMDATIVASSPTIVVSHPDDPAVLMTSGNVIQESYATRDGGATWAPFSPTTSGDELRVDPHDTDRVLIVDEMTGVFESLDGGRTFDRIAQEFGGAKILDFEIAPDDPSQVFVSNLGVGISRSGVGGWQHMSGSPDYAYDIELDPADSRILYATNSPKKSENHASVWRYRPDQALDFGWSEILRVEPAAGVTSLRFDPSDPETLYAGITGPQGGLWVSRDRGDSWEELNPALTFTTVQGHSQLEVAAGDEDTVFVGTWGGGSFRSTDSGATWISLDDDHTFSPTCIEVSPSDPSIVYACDRTAPLIHRSTDGGVTWELYFDFGPDHLTTTALAIDPGDPDVIYAAAFRPPAAMRGSLYRIKGGVIEAEVGGGLPRAALDIAIDEEAPSTLYVTTHLHGLFASDDAGSTWRRLDDRGSGLPRTGYFDVDVDPHDFRTLYASSFCGRIPAYVIDPLRRVLGQGEQLRNINSQAACGLYRSADRGESWELILETKGDAKGLEVSRARPGSLYVADGSGGVWASDDDGASWRQENEGLGTTSVDAVSVGQDRLYAGTQGSGVYVGTVAQDGSISWDGEQSPRAYVYRVQIEVDPRDPDRLYASAYPGGVLRSDDGGDTWSAKNFLTPSIRVDDPTTQGYYAMAIDPADPDTVWLGVYGEGLIKSADGRDFGTFANGVEGTLRGAHITSVEVETRDGQQLLVGAEEGVFATSNAGKTWRRLDEGLGTSDVRSLKLSAVASPTFEADFEGGDTDGFELDPGWRIAGGKLVGKGHHWASAGSSDWTDYSFVSWVKLRKGAVHLNVRVNDDGRYFIGVNPEGLSLSKTTDAWQKHKLLAEAPARVGNKPHRIRVDVTGPRIRVYLDGKKKIDFRDRKPHLKGRIAFESLEDLLVAVDRARVKPAQPPSRAFVGTGGYGLYRLDGPGGRWSHLGRTLGVAWWAPWERRMYQFSSILFDPRQRGVVYYGHFPGGFYVSRDGGHTWRDSSVGLGNDGMFSLVQHPDDPAVLFAGTYNGIARTTDGGATWSDSSQGMPSEQWPYTVAIDSDDPDVMYTSTKNGQNKGFCHRNSFCGVVMKSSDGGRTWTRIMSGLDPMSEFYTLIIYPPDHDTLFLSTSRGVFASLDAGEHWWPMNTGLPATENQVRDNVADNLALSEDDGYLFLGLVKHGAWRADLATLGDD